jgi:PAS domain S-box-containing protein
LADTQDTLHSAAFLSGGGEMGALIRSQDWLTNPLGPPEGWPSPLRTAIRLILNTGHPMYIWWGPELRCFYNDAYRRSIGPERHPGSLGKPAREVWGEIWDIIGPQIEHVMAGRGATWNENQLVPITRNGRREDVYWTYSYSPIDDEAAVTGVGGVLVVCSETTRQVLAEREKAAEHERLRRMFEQAPGFMAILLGQEHVFELANAAYMQLVGHRDVIGKTVRNALPDLEGQGFFELLDNVYETGEPFVGRSMPADLQQTPGAPVERRFLDFVYQPITDASGGVTGIFAEGSDVTDRVVAEGELRERETRLEMERELLDAVIRQAPVGISITEAPSGRSLALNDKAIEIIGHGELGEDASRYGLYGARHPDGRPYTTDEYPTVRAFRRGEVVPGEETVYCTGGQNAHGPLRRVQLASTPVRDRGGNIVAAVTAFVDLEERYKAEEALRESEARFRNMADSAPVIMWVTDPSGRCTHLNARWYEFTGQELGAGEGYGWLDCVHPHDRPLAEQAFVSANAERRNYQVDFRLRRGDGIYRWVIDAAAARFTESGDYLGYVGSVIDIDERREAEARLALSEEQLRLATEAAEIGLWDVDLVTDALFWPARVKAMFGISPDVPVSMADFYAGLHPDDRAHTSEAFQAATDPSQRAVYDVEYRTVGKEDGVVRWVAAKGRGLFTADGACTRVIGTAIDITARKAVEVRLRELNEQLEQRVADRTAERNRVWEMSRDLLAIMGFDGHLKAINPAWEVTLGRDSETLLSLSFRDQVHPDDHAAVKAMMERLLRGETVSRFEDRLRHADGSWRWISWTLVPEGDVFYAVGRDVTAEKEAAAELEHAQEALRQSQKMDAMGQLTGGVAHDFNNLLTPIVGGLDMLQRRGVGGEREQRLIAGAIQSADRAKMLVQRLLAFARRQPLQPVPVDVGQLVEGMAELLASTTGPQVRVVVESGADLPPAKADPNQLEMALLNLGVNARDAMPHGGTLRISVTAEQVGQHHRAKLKSGRYLRLSVADTGIGMDEATLARAVEPFFSTKGIGKGTGLGLSMAHGLASQLGGALTIESRLGVGTNIELWLPATAVTTEASEDRPGALAEARALGTALLVDDEELVRMSTADMLSDLGYEVREAASAEEALRLLRSGLNPTLLVTDHLMPGMNGTDLARAVRSERPHIQVLVVSGYAETDGIAPDLPRLTKPFRNADLAESLANPGRSGGS